MQTKDEKNSFVSGCGLDTSLTGGVETGERCKCHTFVKDFIGLCEKRWVNVSVALGGHGHVPYESCESAVYEMWTVKERLADNKLWWIAMIYLSRKNMKDLDAANRATYWCGYAFSIGTRAIMEDFISTAIEGCDSTHPFDDLESAARWIGQLMREGDWYHPCHRAHHDGSLWQHLSQAFLYMQQQSLDSMQETIDLLLQVQLLHADAGMQFDDIISRSIEARQQVHWESKGVAAPVSYASAAPSFRTTAASARSAARSGRAS